MPLPRFVAELAAVHTQIVPAENIEIAAAVAQAVAAASGFKVIGIYSETVWQELQAEKVKGKTVGKK
jgi:hypothetical protein